MTDDFLTEWWSGSDIAATCNTAPGRGLTPRSPATTTGKAEHA